MKNKKPIRVAHVVGKMIGGGVEAVVMNYYRHIDKSDIQFDFIIDSDSTIVPEKEILQMGGRIYRVSPYQKPIQYQQDLYQLFQKNQYKIVHAHINSMSIFPLYAAKRAGVPIRIAHNHSTAGKGETKKNIMKYMLRPFSRVFPTHLCACSELAGRWLFGDKAFEQNYVTVFNNAIEVDRFIYNEQIRKEVRAELGIEGKFVVGHVGRFCYQKNHAFLIDIFREIYIKRPDAVLILAGHGELMQAVKERVHTLNLGNAVQFLGTRNDVNRLYQAMDVFILPSRYEGLPVVGVESQTADLPCVYSEAMTAETKFLDSTYFLGLDSNVKIWAETAWSISRNHIRRNIRNKVIQAGFEIHSAARKLHDFYFDCIKGEANEKSSDRIVLFPKELRKRTAGVCNTNGIEQTGNRK